MARRKPDTEAAFIAWSRSRVDQWLGGQGGPPDIGLSLDQINQADALVTDLENKHSDMLANAPPRKRPRASRTPPSPRPTATWPA